MRILKPFVEGIYQTNLESLKMYNEYFTQKVVEAENKNLCTQNHWRCDTFNYSLNGDLIFHDTLNIFKEHVSIFAKNYKPKNTKVKCDGAWLNLSKPNSFQEYHIHSRSHFSAVYYIKVPENSGRIVFKKHGSNNMFDLETLDFNEFNSLSYHVQPRDCDFLIFRSDLEHMVEKNRSSDYRISLAMNFTIND